MNTQTETEAYPENPDPVSRNQQTFAVGDRVRVGPAYVGGGNYRSDFACGVRYVVRAYSDGNYRVASKPGGPYFATVCTERLVPA